MFERIFAAILGLGIAACGVRGGTDAPPPQRQAAKSAPVASKPGPANGARDLGAAPSAEQRPVEQHPTAPNNALVLQRRGVSLAPDGKGLVLEPLPSSPEEAARAGLFRRIPETAAQDLGGGAK